MAGQLILGLTILISLHELGHFLAARAFGIKVEKFYLFFDAWGIKLFKFKRGDTEYGIGWLPLGGYVKIAGMIDESLDTDQLASEPEKWEFRAKPAWQRLIVMVAGVVMNILLGMAIYSYTLIEFKETWLPNEAVNAHKGIYAYELGRAVGLQDGDRITAINGEKFERFEDLLSTRVMLGATLSVERNHQTVEIEVPGDFYRRFGGTGKLNFIGYGPLEFVIGKVSEGGPADKAGLKAGDMITSINGKSISGYDELSNTISGSKNKTVNFTVVRDRDTLPVSAMVGGDGLIGISYGSRPVMDEALKTVPYTISSALAFGTSDALEAVVSNAKGLKGIFRGEVKASESVQGPIGIANIYGGVWDWARFWAITGLLSMVIAMMNMLPIPALDGGHVLFLLIESIFRYKFSDKVMERVQVVGMVILMSLMIFAIGNDIWRHVLN